MRMLRWVFLGRNQVYILLALLALAAVAWDISAPSWIVALARASPRTAGPAVRDCTA